MTIHIVPIDKKTASEAEYAALYEFVTHMRTERLPDDPLPTQEDLVSRWRNIPPIVTVSSWIAWNEDRANILGQGDAVISNTDDNQHLLQFKVEVLPEYRRQGIGRRLLAELMAVPQRENRRLMITETHGRVPAGGAFMQRLGAIKGLEAHTNQLDLTKLDCTLLQQWQEKAQERARGFGLGLWTGAYPDEQIEAVVELYKVMNQQPFDDLEVEDFTYTAEQLRQIEQVIFADGTERWTFYTYEKETGNLAGFTETQWRPSQPALLEQGNTGVFPEYRNHGLGRWLKAVMLEKILKDRPQVRWVRTGNADSNAPMLRINQELGFEPYDSEIVWQVETEKVAQYLAS